MLPRLTAAAALAAALLATPLVSSAAAVTPTPNAKSKLIVAGKSIGGLALGASYATMTKLWGTPSTCNGAKTVCAYYARAGSAQAVVRYTKGAVSTLDLQASPSTHKAGTLSIYRDEIGVRLGLRSAQIGQAYPTGTWHSASVFVIPGPGAGETVITATKGKITDLMVRVAPDKLAG